MSGYRLYRSAEMLVSILLLPVNSVVNPIVYKPGALPGISQCTHGIKTMMKAKSNLQTIRMNKPLK